MTSSDNTTRCVFLANTLPEKDKIDQALLDKLRVVRCEGRFTEEHTAISISPQEEHGVIRNAPFPFMIDTRSPLPLGVLQSLLNGLNERDRRPIRTIGVRGDKPGCGKDTVSDYSAFLLEQKGIHTHRAAFADGVREDVSKITGVPVELIRTPEGKNMVFEELGVTIGKMLQYHGQAKKKLHGDDVWVSQCINSLPTDHVSIISDVRYKKEQTAVKERDGIIIMVKSNRPTSAILMAGRSLQHSSERDLDGVPADYVIENNGTLEEVQQAVKRLIDSLFP